MINRDDLACDGKKSNQAGKHLERSTPANNGHIEMSLKS